MLEHFVYAVIVNCSAFGFDYLNLIEFEIWYVIKTLLGKMNSRILEFKNIFISNKKYSILICEILQNNE